MAILLEKCTLEFAWLAIPLNVRPIRQSQDNQTYEVVTSSLFIHLNLIFLTLIQYALQKGLPPWQWTLPHRFILKTRNPDIDGRLFARETEIYARLAHLQGRLIPRYYGVVKVRKGGTLCDAHLLEKIDGLPLTHYAQAHESLSALEDKIFQAFGELSQACIVHGDAELRNILVMDGDIKLVDFELAEVHVSKEEAQIQNVMDLKTMFRQAVRKVVP